MKKWGIIIIGILLLSVVIAQVYLAGVKFERLDYLRVVDGDTIWVRNFRDGSEWKVRFWAINAPDVKECYFSQSKNILEKELVGKKITFEKKGYDGYGRILARVFADGVDVQEMMVATGAAIAYDAMDVHDELRPSKEDFQKLKLLEENAKNEKLGIWSKACVSM